MADRTLTINHADGGSETYTINRDKFAGVRDMVVDGANVSVDHTAVPKGQSKETTFGGSQSITVNRDIEPLLSKVVGGAAAAYSLRDLNDSQGNNNVVRVRRESDNSEKDFLAKEVSNGTMARWVNEQPTLPLDLRELDTNTGERDGDLIEAAAAYSLRKLKEDFTGDVVEVRRNVDGETEGFTADEVTDGTLESFVNASFDDELPLDQATGAAAAYSLRNLSSSFTGDVVEVRRSSDDAVQSFTASEVADGTLEDWVNGDVVTYESDFSAGTDGFNAFNGTVEVVQQAYGKNDCLKFTANNITEWLRLQRNGTIKSGHTYKITSEVYIPSSNEHLNGVGFGNLDGGVNVTGFDQWIPVDGAFTSDSPNLVISAQKDGASYNFEGNGTDVFYVRNVQITQTTADGHVRTWYDQSGNTNHAVQTTPANQPKIVEGGTLVTDGIDFDGTDDFLSINFGAALSQPNSIFMVHTSDTATDSKNEFFDSADGTPRTLFDQSGSYYRMFAGTDQPTSLTIDANQKTLVGAFYNTTSSFLSKNGTVSSTLSVGTNSIDDTSNIGYSNASYYDGTMDEFIIYDSDQSTKRRAIEENIANHYDISLAAFSRDGTVSTWYDQSETNGVPNANHATQTDPTKQPKIVDGGTLKDHLDFDGNVFMDIGAFLMDGTDASTVMVMSNVDTDVETFYLSNRSGAGGFNFKNDTSNKGKLQYSFIGSGSSTTSDVFVADNTDAKFITTITKDTNDREFFGNGSQLADDGASNTYTQATGTPNTSIGKQGNSSASATNKKLRVYEIISYNLELDDNRTAIEANIGETYGITAIPAANDTVNGYVQTWYDQSGNGNDAEQTTASSQPKIIEGGSLNRDSNNNVSVKFDSSSDQYLENASLPSSFTSSNATFSDFTVQEAFQNNVTTAAWGFGSTNSSARRLMKLFHSSGSFGYQGYGSTTSYISAFNTASYSANEVLLSGGVRVGTDLDIFKNSADADMDTSFDTGTINLNTFAIGSYVRSSGSTNTFNGNIAEIIIYDSDQSSNRPAIEANINNQYDIY